MCRRLARCSSDWFEFQKSVFLDILGFVVLDVSVGATLLLTIDWSNLVRLLKSVLGFFHPVLCFTLSLVWERLSRFRFDAFQFRTSDFGFLALKVVWERLCLVALTDRLWFEFRIPFYDFFRFRFCFLTLKLSCGSAYLPFVFISSTRESPIFISILFRLKAVWKRLFLFSLTESGSGFEIRFQLFSVLSLASS